MQATGYIRIAAALLLLVAPADAAAARGQRVAVRVLPRFPLARFADRGAVGSMVPASGSTVSRATARASLLRGKLENALLGGKPTGRSRIRLGGPPASVTIYLTLPPAGKHHNLARYPIAVVGGGYHGLLRSSGTRITGIVSIADVAPTVEAIERGEKPVLSSRPSSDASSALADLNTRLDAAHFARRGASRVLIGLVFAFAAVAWAFRSKVAARASLLSIPAILAAALVVSALHAEHRLPLWIALIALVSAVSLALATRTPGRLAAALAALLATYALTLLLSPTTVSLAVLGPHPEGGGRFFGVTNQIETLLLAPALALGALVAAPLLATVALASAVLLGWSRMGADGGGLIVFAAGFTALALRVTGTRLTPARVIMAGAAVVGLGLALVGVDALSGGSSHVTHAVGAGPGALLSDLGHRLHLSWAGITNKTDHLAIAIVSLVALAVLALQRPRAAALDALLVALSVSLVVNDSGFDILRFGALTAIAVFTWTRVPREGPRSVCLDIRSARPVDSDGHAGEARTS